MNYDYMAEEEECIVPDVVQDMVNHPPHYQGDIECIDAIQVALGEHFPAYCRGTAMKYIWRTGKKWDADEDIKKAIWYLERSMKVL